MKKRVTVFPMVAAMLFTFCIAFLVKAVVPLFVWAVWAIGVGVIGVGVVADQTRSDHEQAQANNQPEEEPKGVNRLLFDKVVDQGRNVPLCLSERGNHDWEHIEAKPEVFPELPESDHGLEIRAIMKENNYDKVFKRGDSARN
jgi:hypothetical protein